MSLTNLLLVGTGSFLGGNARYLLSMLFVERFGRAFPYGTLFVNVTGSFVIGLILAFLLPRIQLGDNYRLFLATGICGGYTTFSTFTYDSWALFQNGYWERALLYVAGSMVLGLIAVALGVLAGRAL